MGGFDGSIRTTVGLGGGCQNPTVIPMSTCSGFHLCLEGKETESITPQELPFHVVLFNKKNLL